MPVAALTCPTLEQGYFGPYGGQFVPETLRPALKELEFAYEEARRDPAFQRAFDEALATFTCRPTPLHPALRLSEQVGAKVFLKREDLNHTGAHKINNTLGQILLAQRMGKTRVIAETGAGQHGVATAAAAARLGLRCEVHMGEEDIRRQRLNVQRMELMGAKVIPATCGTRTLKDATNEAIRDWVAHVADTYYLIGSVVGPHPYPTHGPGLPVHDRAGNKRAVPACLRASAGRGGGLRGRRFQCHGHVPPLRARSRRGAGRR